MGGGPGGGGGGKEGFEPKEPGLKLDEDEDGLGPYLLLAWMSSGVDWLKFLIGGLLVRRGTARGPGT